MKKLFLALFAVVAFSACSKSEISYDAPSEIVIKPYAQNITKAMLTDTEFPNEQFNVWAFYKQIPQGTTIAEWQASTLQQTPYINNKPFKQTSADAKLWSGVVSYYWPKEGSLLFVGYYPTTAPVTYEFTSGENAKNIMSITDYTPGMVTTAATYTEDLMYFNMTPASYNGATYSSTDVTGSNVDVVFRHALSWVSVVLAKEANTPDGATITVNSVKFTDILPSGDATVNNSPVAPATNEIVWTADGTAADIEVCPESPVTLEKNNVAPLDKQPILIPQTMTGKNLVINYTITSSDNSAFTETKTIALSGMTGTSGTGDNAVTESLTTWQPAKHYTYTITIGTTEILIDPAVEAWTDVPVSVPIQ